MSDTIGVCGFGRCGSSMVMAMLDAGGIPPVDGSADRSYELPGLDSLPSLTPAALAGRAVKLLDGITYYSLPAASWRFIWLDRDGRQQARSFVKFSRALGIIGPGLVDLSKIEASYVTDRPRLLAAYGALGPVLTLTSEGVLAYPFGSACVLADFLGRDFDTDAASRAVHRRSGECREGISFERFGVPA